MLSRRMLRLIFAVGFALWQFEWTALAAAHQGTIAHAHCDCRGTAGCCCLHRTSKPTAEGSHHSCHLGEATHPSRASDYLLEPVGCGNSPTAVALSLQRDAQLPFQTTAIAQSSPKSADLPIVVFSDRSVFLDPPFVPPEIFVS